MSAEVLRRAASLMRRRAGWCEPGPWEAGEHIVSAANGVAVVSDGNSGDGGTLGADHAEHIASWHPGVALAVADLLDLDADSSTPDDYDESQDVWRMFALKVARAYLGESS